ncbi:NADase-type glycan-binding domain-containing protein [Streptomyces sp. NPDC003393]
MTTTQSCAECGSRAEPGQSFCEACGAVLSWGEQERAAAAAGRGGAAPTHATAHASVAASDVRAVDAVGGSGSVGGDPGETSPVASPTEPAAPASPDSSDSSPARGGVSPRSGTDPSPPSRDPLSPDTAPPHPGGGSVSPAPSGPDSPGDTFPDPTGTLTSDDTSPTVPVAPARPASHTGEPEGMTTRARRLLVPVADPEPRPDEPVSVTPVLPGRPVPRRPQVVQGPGEEPGALGGIPCPWCATPNRPDRHFCVRCALPMAGDGQVAGRLPWWRRILARGDRDAPWAGERPPLRRAFDRILGWLGAAVVLTLLIVLAVNIPKGVQATRDHFARRAPVAPDRWAASRSFPGHKPASAFDNINNTWWGPGVSQSGQGQWIEARFDQPTRLLDLIITPGESPRADKISHSALPHRIEARITHPSGKTETRGITLDQGAGPQRRAFRVGEVIAVRFTIESSYGISAQKQVAIAEIEFFGPSHSGRT